MTQYWKHYFWEYLMCVATASMLLLNTAQGFYIPASMADNWLLALVACGVLLVVFFLGGYNKITLVLVPAVTGGLAVLAFLLLRSKGVDIVDSAGSATAVYIYWFALVIICIVVYLLSRFRLGIVLLFVAGCCVHAMLQFLEYQVMPWAGTVFAGSCILLFLLRQYRNQAIHSSTAQPDFFRFFRSGLLMVLAAALLSCGVFFAVIRPMDPPTMELKFLERYLAFQIIEHTGISSYYPVPDPETFTDQADDTRDDTAESPGEDMPEDQQEDPQEELPETAEEPKDDMEALAGQTPLSAVSYTVTPASRVILIVLCILLVLFLPPLLRVWARRRQMKKLASLEPAQQIQALYRFYLKKFQRLGWRKRAGETPFEFAARSGEALERYLSGTCGLDKLTEAFVSARYGTDTPSGELCAACREIYGQFLKNCKTQMGTVRYLLKFYVL